MNILLVEDDDTKAERIIKLIVAELGDENVDIERTDSVNGGILKLGGRFDVVIVDLMLPQISNGTPTDATSQWCELIESHLSGKTSSWIVMTEYAEVAEGARESFARHGVVVIHYDESCNWERLLSSKLKDNFVTRALDFVIVCALEKERRGYQNAGCGIGDFVNIVGLDCRKVRIGPYRGVIVVQPNPGMISAAIVSTKALAIFRPRAIAMSGICGGREGETSLGALIVPDVSWNYQSGKFKDGVLTPDLLQAGIPPQVRSTLAHLLADDTVKNFRSNLMHQELINAPGQLVPMVSGSQVVADKTVGNLIGEQGRKVAGVDMEVASVLFAAHDFFNGSGIYFAAKTVVDLADLHKDDRYHEYGCALSAQFVCAALGRLLDESSATM